MRKKIFSLGVAVTLLFTGCGLKKDCEIEKKSKNQSSKPKVENKSLYIGD